MHRLAIKRTTKNEAQLSPNTHVTAFVRPPVGTVPFAATADTCAETAECRLQCTRRGVRTANLHAVRSAKNVRSFTGHLITQPLITQLPEVSTGKSRYQRQTSCSEVWTQQSMQLRTVYDKCV